MGDHGETEKIGPPIKNQQGSDIDPPLAFTPLLLPASIQLLPGLDLEPMKGRQMAPTQGGLCQECRHSLLTHRPLHGQRPQLSLTARARGQP